MLVAMMTNNVQCQDDFYFKRWPQTPTGLNGLLQFFCVYNNWELNYQEYYGLARACDWIAECQPRIV